MRAVSQVVTMLLIAAFTVAACTVVAAILSSFVARYGQCDTRLVFISGRAFVDPSSPTTLVGEVTLSKQGSARIEISEIDVVYEGNVYRATCLNCDVIEQDQNTYPYSSNDFVYVRFYVDLGTRPTGLVDVIIKYRVGSNEYSTKGTLIVEA